MSPTSPMNQKIASRTTVSRFVSPATPLQSFEQVALDYPDRPRARLWCGRRLGRHRFKRGFYQFGNRPNVIGDPKRHCWRHPQRLMRAAEIVERDVQRDRRKVAVQLFAKP